MTVRGDSAATTAASKEVSVSRARSLRHSGRLSRSWKGTVEVVGEEAAVEVMMIAGGSGGVVVGGGGG
eukprot:CAMPEP_0174891260 /NCGR_PEP_ID=MMETSP0167-20121228/6328_1 /TAXON_ID=38298 /ORGANISM="Rhodella maculata, Strain CCMP736" /LENGTH=67 /DNA_ID=CAMNT_0016129347 /DNA_START=91 /DNA_END=291 /DNA_ORIENTATION=+